ncbi:hypothetical protein F5Y04DRAFT_262452 [Hypomontagnella monticulosa]|nr:hypothetical protein F5Y04DRAFT_262452 [Hypomontagnella monticulosa]
MSRLDYSHIPPDQLEEFLEGPALPPPEGVTPNFKNPENQNGPALFLCIFAIVVSTIVLMGRFYVRLFYAKKLHFIDALALASYAFFLAITIGSIRGVASGPGLFAHQWNLQAKNMKIFLYTAFIGTNFYGAAMLLLKTAILWEWIRIFVPLGTRNLFFKACFSMAALNIAYYIAIIILSSLACRPFQRNWDKTIPGECIDITIINISSAVVNFVLDVAILSLPQRVIWGLHMSTKKRLGVSILFAVGILACAAAAARIGSAVAWYKSDDTLYHFSFISTWGITELTCGFLIFSIPAIPKAFLGGRLPGWVSSVRSWAGVAAERLRGSSSDQSRWRNRTALPPRTYQHSTEVPSSYVHLKTLNPEMDIGEQELGGSARLSNQIIHTVEFRATESSNSQLGSEQAENIRHNWYLEDDLHQQAKPEHGGVMA